MESSEEEEETESSSISHDNGSHNIEVRVITL